MSTPRRWLLACLLLALVGCATHHGDCGLVAPPACDACQLARCHVHIFLLNGADPLDSGHLADVRDECQRLGFRQTYYGYLWNAGWMERELGRVRKEDPGAHIVLIGHGGGVETLRAMAKSAAAAGATIDMLLVATAGETVVLGGGPLPERPLGSATDIEIQAQLAPELEDVARHVAVEQPIAAMPEYGPTPRPVLAEEPQANGPDWDSLRPAVHLTIPKR
jgi:hypothetical protein